MLQSDNLYSMMIVLRWDLTLTRQVLIYNSCVFFQRVDRAERDDWTKLDESPVYKGDNTLREYQLEGVNWLMFSWCNQ